MCVWYFPLFRTGTSKHFLIRLPLTFRAILGNLFGSYSYETGSLSMFITKSPSCTDMGLFTPSVSPTLGFTPSEELPDLPLFHPALQTHFCILSPALAKGLESPSALMCTPGPRAPPLTFPVTPTFCPAPGSSPFSLSSAERSFSSFPKEA